MATIKEEEAWTPWWLKKGKKITLRSCDGVEFAVHEKHLESETIKNTMAAGGDVININNVTGRILEIVVDYFTKCVAKPRHSVDEAFDARLCQLDDDTLLELMLVAHHLKVDGLLDWTAREVARILRKKSIEEQREWLKIEDDLTPEEKEEIMKTHDWAFK